MEHKHTITGSIPGEVRIRFHQSGIDFNVHAQTAEQQAPSPELASDLGHHALELFDQPDERTRRMGSDAGRLIASLDDAQSLEPGAIAEPSLPVISSPRIGHEAEVAGTSDFQESLNPDESDESYDASKEDDLSPAQQRCERTILYLLEQPEFKYTSERNNAGGELRAVLDIARGDWRNLVPYLQGEKVLVVEKYSARRTKSFGVNIHQLLSTDAPFVSQKVRDKIRAALDGEPEAPNPTDPDEIETKSGNDQVPAHQISRRVEKAMLLDSGKPTGYRGEAKEHEPFLGHSRRSPKRRQGRRQK